jgi:transposase-like protein
LGSKYNQIPRAITVDKNPAYLPAVNELKNDTIRTYALEVQNKQQ